MIGIPEELKGHDLTELFRYSSRISEEKKNTLSQLSEGKLSLLDPKCREVFQLLQIYQSELGVIPENSEEKVPQEVSQNQLQQVFEKLFCDYGHGDKSLNRGFNAAFLEHGCGKESAISNKTFALLNSEFNPASPPAIENFNLNYQDELQKTLLHHAASCGNEPKVNWLLKQGANPGILDVNGDSPMSLAAGNGHSELIDPLSNYLAGNIAIDQALLNTAGSLKEPQTVLGIADKLMKFKPNLSFRHPSCSYTPLHMAASEGRPEMVSWLVEQGVSPDIQDVFGWTPLLMAAYKGREDKVIVLLDKGANPTFKNRDGLDVLAWAVYSKNEKLVDYLLSHVDCPKKIWDLGCALYVLYYWTDQDRAVSVAGKLLDHGASCDFKWPITGETILHCAAGKPSGRQLYDFLVSRGADPEVVNSRGESAAHINQTTPVRPAIAAIRDETTGTSDSGYGTSTGTFNQQNISNMHDADESSINAVTDSVSNLSIHQRMVADPASVAVDQGEVLAPIAAPGGPNPFRNCP